VGVATDRNRSVEGDGDRMADVLRLVVVRGDRRGGDELLLLGLESIEILPLDNDAAAVAIAD